MSGSEKRFWFLFILLNFIQFLPAYLVNSDTSTFFPFNTFTHEKWYEIMKSFFRRDNYDIFRLSLDLVALATLFFFFRARFRIGLYSHLSAGYFLILLIFLVYYYSMYKIFLIEPVIFNDLYLLKIGYQNIDRSTIFVFLLLFLVIGLVYFLFYKLFSKLYSQLRNIYFGRISKIIMITTLILILISIVRSGITFEAIHEFQLGSGKLIDNFKSSAEIVKSISELNLPEINKKSENYKSFTLSAFPDVYLLFIESYGKIVYQDTNFNKLYTNTVEQCEKELSDNGWYVSSGFSKSPVSGGSSWISYSSVLFGLDFKDHGRYLYLLRNPEMKDYTHILRYFKGQGYKSYWINSMPDNMNMEIPWKTYTDFYSIDQWINYNDLNYRGKLYGFGPSPPDQYSLFKSREIIGADSLKPHVVFFISHNSHNPFYCPDSVAGDWKTLNTGSITTPQPSILFKKPKAPDYIKSINYEIRTFSKFISCDRNKNSIYILIGDHQPPYLSTEKNGFETPVHILSTDSIFINNFTNYGFTDGLFCRNDKHEIRHEAIYSMLLREVIRKYGSGSGILPDYLPNGMETE